MKNKYEIRGDKVVIFVKCKGVIFETIIDLVDLERAKEFPGNWSARLMKNGKYYVVGSVGKTRSKEYGGQFTFQLHRWILRAPKEMYVDHKNHDTLKNTRDNIRLATPGQNNQNKLGPQKNNKSSGVLGVTWHKRNKCWQAKIVMNRKHIYLGWFKKLSDAESAVKEARARLMPHSQEALAN